MRPAMASGARCSQITASISLVHGAGGITRAPPTAPPAPRAGRDTSRTSAPSMAWHAPRSVKLSLLDEPLAVCRLPASERVPSWALELHHAFLSLTRTADELSVICPEVAVPPDTDVEPGWRALTVAGPLDFAMTGVLASLAAPLAEAGVPLLAIATHDTDHLLVRADDVDRALAPLAAARPPRARPPRRPATRCRATTPCRRAGASRRARRARAASAFPARCVRAGACWSRA